MLVLTRKSKQQIRVGQDVVITILRVKGQSVRVGIEAPSDVRVVRAELPLFEETSSLEIAPGKSVTTGKTTTSFTNDRGSESSHVNKPALRHGLSERLAARQHRDRGSLDACEFGEERLAGEVSLCLRS